MANWTNEQLQAIEGRGGNLLVAAAAGSGKTAVLVERIIQRICDENNPVDVDRLLVVTFTNLAAAEMKERIGGALNKALKENPLSKHLYKQSTLLNKASIMTLHSFCLEVVRENFFSLGIDPNFRIADDTEAQLLRIDVLEDLLEKYYQSSEEDDDFIKLVDAYGGQRDDGPIEDLIIKIHQFSQSNPWPDYWLDQVVDNFVSHDWFKELLPSLTIELEGVRNYLVQAYKYAQSPQGPLGYLNNIAQELAYVDDLIRAAQVSWQELYETFSQESFKRLPGIKKGSVDENLQARVKELREKAKKKIKDLEDKYFLRAPQEFLEDLTRIQPYLKTLCQLVKDFAKEYQERKAKKNLVDFNDLEHFCLQVLLAEDSQPGLVLPSEVSLKLKERFVEVLVDEYQDINEVQETILSLVAKENNMFMVGDVKQSIYRFRLAKPELFLNKYKSYAFRAEAINRRIDLAKNFRCSKTIVDGVNYLFCQIMTPNVGEMAYDQKAHLVYGAQVPGEEEASLATPMEFYLLEKRQEEELPEELDAIEREAQVIGQRILELIENKTQILDKKTNEFRSLTFRDIVILLRSPKGMAEKIMERFYHFGIPVYAELGSGYFSAIEVQTMLSLLKIIDNPRQDIPLAAVLRSPIVDLSAEDLTEIRLKSPQDSFYGSMLKTSLEDTPLAQKLKAFLAKLEEWRTVARQGNLADLIWTLYRETGYLDYVGALPGGVERQANLQALHDRARQYEATSFRGLFRFLRFLERIEENKGDLESAKALSENENVVRIMSIHKSKGLEFPVVFVAGLGKKFNLSDGQQNIVIHKDLGLGPVFIDSEKRIKYPTIAKLVIENKILLETLAEEMRILYVALTRARERLILIGSVNNATKKIENWAEILEYQRLELPDSLLVQGKTYLDWLGLALIRHKGAAQLRSCIDYNKNDGYLIDDQSQWQFTVLTESVYEENDEEVAANLEFLEEIKDLKPLPVDAIYQEIIAEKLSWHYPYQELLDKGAKVTVSEVKHKFHKLKAEEEYKPYYGFSKRPLFKQKAKGLSPEERGSAIHLVMEHIELDKTIDADYLEEFLAYLENQEILTPEQRTAIDINYIIDFFQSDLGQRMQKSVKVKREVAFSLALPANEMYDLPSEIEEKILVQGVIDCLWWEEDGWVLLDYKSDRVQAGQIEEILQKYTGQISLYTRAVEKILKAPVKERYIYLFNLGKSVPII